LEAVTNLERRHRARPSRPEPGYSLLSNISTARIEVNRSPLTYNDSDLKGEGIDEKIAGKIQKKIGQAEKALRK
jgi:hypothetical protein